MWIAVNASFLHSEHARGGQRLGYVEKLEARGDSVLAQLTAEEFEVGLAAVRRHVAVHSGEPVVEVVDLFVFSESPIGGATR